MVELCIVPHGQFELLLIGKRDQTLRVRVVEREWFLHIDMTATIETEAGNLKMAFRRRGNVNDIRSGFLQQFCQVCKLFFDLESLSELLGHERLRIADPHHLAAADSLDMCGMSIGNLATAYNGDFQHFTHSPGSLGKTSSSPRS